MQKKGASITFFILLALVVLIFYGLYYSYTNKPAETKPEYFQRQLAVSFDRESFDAYMKSCISKKGEPLVKLISEKGGTLQSLMPENSVNYHYTRYRYFCRDSLTEGCVNNLITRKEIEKELSRAMEESIPDCINISIFEEEGFKVTLDQIEVETSINTEDVKFTVDYPMSFEKPNTAPGAAPFRQEFSTFESVVDHPLGKLYDLAVKIVNDEIILGRFDKDAWMKDNGVEIKIEKHKPYPDVVYKLGKRIEKGDRYYVFNFAIDGKDTASMLGMNRQQSLNPHCYIEYDNNYYANAVENECTLKSGIVVDEIPQDYGPSKYDDPECTGFACKDCPSVGKEHGDTWCYYPDKYAGSGLDRVGSRHYVYSCMDGDIIMEECRDYREELCTTGPFTGQAVCRVNRWEDCAKQQTSLQCQNAAQRDCIWNQGLDLGIDSGRTPMSTRFNSKCYPIVPPGFKHWTNNADRVCQMANQAVKFEQPTFKNNKGNSMPNTWVDSGAVYCVTMGDCGEGQNIAGQSSLNKYFNTDEYIPEPQGRTPFNAQPGQPRMMYPPTASKGVSAPTEIYTKRIINPPLPPVPTFMAIAIQFAYIAEASSWSECDDVCEKCICFPGTDLCIPTPITSYECFDQYITGVSICRQWTAPIAGNCNLCNSQPACGEYTCRSLGMNCQYIENPPGSGVYECTENPAIYNLPDLTLELDTTSIAPNPPFSFESGDLQTYGDNLFESEKVVPNVPQNNEFGFVFRTNRPATCTAKFDPTTDYYSMSMLENVFSYFFGRGAVDINDDSLNHFVSIRAISAKVYADRVEQMLDITDPHEPAMPNFPGVNIVIPDILRNPLVLRWVTTQTGLDLTQLQNFPSSIGWDTIMEDVFNVDSEDMSTTIRTYLSNLVQEKVQVYFKCIDEYGKESEPMLIGYRIEPQDNTRPEIELIGPEEDFVLQAGNDIKFSFVAKDDYVADMNCYLEVYDADTDELLFDSNIIPASSDEEASYTKGSCSHLGPQKWKIKCSDGYHEGISIVRKFSVVEQADS